jgi:HTH-type transcriptional repressor of NAD biosynthesis genes
MRTDSPFVQDGTRQGDGFRAQQHEWYLAELAARGISFAVVTGSLAERMVAIEQSLVAT